MKKLVVLLFVLTLVSGLVFGKGGAEIQQAAGPETDYGTITESVTIEFWHNYSNKERAAFLDDVVARFNAENDMIKVKGKYIGGYPVIAEQIAGAMAAGKGLPALSTMNVPRVLNFAASEIIEPLEGYFSANGISVDDYYEGLIDSVSDKNGTLYGFPFGISAGTVIYNKSLVDGVGMPLPDTWDAFKVWCKEIHEKTGLVAFSFPYDFNYMNTIIINATGKDPLGNGEVSNLDDPEFLELTLEIKDLVDKGYCVWTGTKVNDAAAEQIQLFSVGQIVAYTSTSSDIMNSINRVPFEIGTMVGFSRSSDIPAVTTSSGAALVIYSENDQNIKNAAFKFAAYLTDIENITAWASSTCMFPVKRGVLEQGMFGDLYARYPGVKPVMENVGNIISKNKSVVMQQCMEMVVTSMGEIIRGNVNPSTEWPLLKRKVDAALADAL